jgi:hypothetical protein
MKTIASGIGLGLLALLLSAPGDAHSQVIENGQLTGRVVSRSLLEGTAYAVPATGHLVITQLCLTPITLGNSASTVPRLVGSSSGTLYSPLAMSNGTTTANVVAADSCVRWTPGFAVQQGENLTCTGGSMATNETCAFTGVMTDR